VRKGQPLFSIYSPELYQAEVNYQVARKQALASRPSDSGGEDPALSSARERLRLWDVPDEQIAALDAPAAPDVHSIVVSRSDGVVLRRAVVEGALVEPGMVLFEMSDLSRVWILVDLFAEDAGSVAVGQEATVEVVGSSAAALHGRVAFVYPSVN